MRNEGLGSWPARRARKTPQRTALIHQGHTITYGELHQRTTRLAHVLRDVGIKRGDRVAYLGPNCPSFLETFFAAGTLGAIFVPLNTRLTAPEIAYQLRDCDASVLLHAPSHTALAEAAREGTEIRTTITAGGPHYEQLLTAPAAAEGTSLSLPSAGGAPCRQGEATGDISGSATGTVAEPLDEPVLLDEVCILMYTSGTMGRPKGAMLTHANLTWNAVNVLADHDLIADEVALVCAPLFHTAGLNMLTLPVLLKGGVCVLVEAFDPDSVFDLITERQVTFMFGVPAMFAQLVRHARWEHADLSSLRILTCGGSPVPRSLIAAYQQRGLTFLQGYGMTEASPGVLFLDAEHAISKAGSAGVPHFFSDVRVVRPDLTPVDVGETGEVVVSGPHVMPGYWGLPQESESAFAGRWFRTGDAARIDEDGYVTIVDRLKDMIISGGENIYPAEVEDALLAHPDIAECAVIGVPDDKWGEVGRAVVVPRPGAVIDPDEVLASLSERLAKYKIPKTVVIAESLPRTASGKLLKTQLRRLHGTT